MSCPDAAAQQAILFNTPVGGIGGDGDGGRGSSYDTEEDGDRDGGRGGDPPRRDAPSAAADGSKGGGGSAANDGKNVDHGAAGANAENLPPPFVAATSASSNSTSASAPSPSSMTANALNSRQYTTEIVRSLFGPSVGPVIADYQCSRSRHSGRLYVAQHASCFYSNLFGIERRILVRHDRVRRVEEKGSTGIRLVLDLTSGEEHVFRSFADRGQVLRLVGDLVAANGGGGDVGAANVDSTSVTGAGEGEAIAGTAGGRGGEKDGGSGRAARRSLRELGEREREETDYYSEGGLLGYSHNAHPEGAGVGRRRRGKRSKDKAKRKKFRRLRKARGASRAVRELRHALSSPSRGPSAGGGSSAFDGDDDDDDDDDDDTDGGSSYAPASASASLVSPPRVGRGGAEFSANRNRLDSFGGESLDSRGAVAVDDNDDDELGFPPPGAAGRGNRARCDTAPEKLESSFEGNGGDGIGAGDSGPSSSNFGGSLKNLFGSFVDMAESFATATNKGSDSSSSDSSVGGDDDDNDASGGYVIDGEVAGVPVFVGGNGNGAAAGAGAIEGADTAASLGGQRSPPLVSPQQRQDFGASWAALKAETVPNYKEVALDEHVIPHESCDLDHFFDQFLSDGAKHSIESYQAKAIGDTEISTTEWKAYSAAATATSGNSNGNSTRSLERQKTETTTNRSGVRRLLERQITFRHKVNAPVGPPSARATKVQTCERFGDRGIVLDTRTLLRDVHNADAFHVEDRLLVEPNGDGAGVKITVRFQVRFVKGTMWKRIIEKMTKSEVTEWFKGYVDMISRALAGAVDGSAPGGDEGAEEAGLSTTPAALPAAPRPQGVVRAASAAFVQPKIVVDFSSPYAIAFATVCILLIVVLVFQLMAVGRAVGTLQCHMLEMKVKNMEDMASIRETVELLQKEVGELKRK